jgi:uncharacterized protein
VKILLTGGTGFVGSALTKKLLNLGHDVTVISSRSHAGFFQHPQLYQLVADTTLPGDWQTCVPTMDAIVNLAGRSVFNYWTKKYKHQIRDSRVLTTRNLVDAIEDGQNTRLLSCSAAGYYGDGGEVELDENSPAGHDFLAEVCKDWEDAAMAAKIKGASVATLRFGVVLGKGGGAISTMKTPFKLALGGPIGNGKQWFPWIHLEDLLQAILYLIDKSELDSSFNFTAPKVVRQKDFASILGKILHRPAILPAPSFVMKVVLGEFGSSLLQGQKVFPRALLENGFEFSYPDVQSALQEVLGE